jgi:hypothetical protein
MKLYQYPRPKGDTGIGFHWAPNVYHYHQGDFDLFAPELTALGVSWLVVLSEPAKPIPEFFIKGLLERGIEPVVRIYTPSVCGIDQRELRDLCRTYASWGVHYVHVFNEPNLMVEWDQWNPSDLPRRFMEYLLPCLETMNAVDGIIPVFTPPSPGGNYWDTEFLKTCLDLINAREKRHLYDKMAMGIHNYASNKPLTWGKGGRAKWPCARPYYCPSGCQDHVGFWAFEWYDEIIRERVGHSLPQICGENGVLPGIFDHRGYPAITEEIHASRNAEICRMTMQGEVPDYFFNNAFWLLICDDGNPFTSQRWYRPDGVKALPQSIEALKALAKSPRKRAVVVPETVRVLQPDGKVQRMGMEEYLKGVLPREMGTGSPMEALKAQAIAARCYAMAAVRSPRHDNADICTTTHCQVWSAKRHADTDRAVEETGGVVAIHDGKPINAFYFGHCDGHTRNSEDVWSAALPYLRSVSCICGYDKMYGHGVGMCQRGAMAMAERFATAEEILKHYYSGVQILGYIVSPGWCKSVIWGRVTDEAGTPQVGMTLILRSETEEWRATTDAEGKYRFQDLPAGSFNIDLMDTEVRKSGIRTRGVDEIEVNLVVPPAPDWRKTVEHRPGVRAIAGVLPRGGIELSVTDPWGNRTVVVSGSKQEYGKGGFELPVWSDATYVVEFLGQAFKVPVQGDFVFITFTERPSEKPKQPPEQPPDQPAPPKVEVDARLLTRWMKEDEVRRWLERIEEEAAFKGLFTIETWGPKEQ